ncbi:DNA topoisomerase I [Candidatus Pacearchaeota archaeon]|nr:DNA topoisomerase I [Candidatus Pacearchaeota archaeon]
MPRKPQKPREQKIAEEFFPVEPQDIKYSIEKKNSPLDVELSGKKEKTFIEKTEVAITKKPRVKGKKPKQGSKVSSVRTKTKKETQYEPKKITLKKDGYELIITEKPQAALKIASALGKSVKKSEKGVPYYEVVRDSKKLVVACAVGHLFTLKQKNSGSGVPVFDLVWVPNYLVKKNDFSKKYYDVLVKLAKGAGALTVATDYDIEGEVIGLNVVRFIANQKDASRMKFSTLTDKELNVAYETKSQSIDWGQAIAGETRHNLDWLYGINVSRMLMNAIKTTGKFRIFSMGRVQGPSLNLIVKKEKEISAFKSEKYFQVFITLENPELELIYKKDIFNKGDLRKFENLIGKTAVASTKKTQETLPPNPPFNLTTLQTESYRLFGLNPGKTLQLAQSLYLAGIISYPRTSSQKLPAAIGYKEILENLAKKYKVEKLITREKPIEGKKSDPAHPSIYPTAQGSPEALEEDERKIYELIVKRFLCLFMDDAIVENKIISVDVNSNASGKEPLTFIKKGSGIKKSSWLRVYPSRFTEKALPDVTGEVKIANSRIEEKETQPPRRYSQASILTELEKRNLGTKATRASILETLYNRGYIQDQNIKATPLGISLIESLEKHSPIIIDEALTRTFEREMEQIQQAKKGYVEKEEKVIEKAKEAIVKISEQFKKKEKEIGNELLKANTEFREQQKEENKLNICPLCKKGNLQILYSKKTRRYFVACNKYPECKNTYSLPPNGSIKKTGKVCESCGWPILMRLNKGKRPWEFCFNKDCVTNKERIEKYRQKQQEENSGQ